MKKRILAILTLAAVLTTLIACSSGSAPSYTADSANYDGGAMAQSAAPAEAPAMYDMVSNESYEMESTTSIAESDAVTGGGEADITTVSMTEKIIYNASSTIETMDFEKSIDTVDEMITKFGGFIQSSNVSGIDYYSKSYGGGGRSANYTIRVPVDNYKGMTDGLSAIGNVTYLSSYAENVTTQYYDSQSRLNTYRTEEDRLLEMLVKVDTIEAMIAIESRMSDIRYQIESLQSQLTNWDNSVRYSTVSIYLYEVSELTVEVPVVRTYWQQVGDGLQSSLRGIASFFKNFFKGLIAALPVLIILAVIAVIVLIVVRRIMKKTRAKKAAPPLPKVEDDTQDKD